MNSLEKLLKFLDCLEKHGLYFHLDKARSEAIMARVDVPGQRWEVEFFADGHVEVEVFQSRGDIEGEEALDRLFDKHAD